MAVPTSPYGGWTIGISEDSRNGGRLGLVARRRSDLRGMDAIRVNWQRHGAGHEIAARLRELANALDDAEADRDDHIYEG